MREQSHSANMETIVNHDVEKVDKLQQERIQRAQTNIVHKCVAEFCKQ